MAETGTRSGLATGTALWLRQLPEPLFGFGNRRNRHNRRSLAASRCYGLAANRSSRSTCPETISMSLDETLVSARA